MKNSVELKVGVFEQIREKVKLIPKGKVTTYGAIANSLNMRDSRKVGWAIYGNQDNTIPCHRVVAKDGSLAKKFSLGGIAEHRKRLEEDGIFFEELDKVNLSKYLWTPS